MEPRIATLLDQSPHKRLTLDPSVLTTSSSIAPRYIEPAASGNAARSNLDSHSHHDHVDVRTRTSSHTQSGAPLARVLNDPSSASHVPQLPSGRQTPQHAAFRPGSDSHALGPPAISPDARRREELSSPAGYSGSDISLIQLPKPPQVPRKTAKRPRIPPLLQGLHQPPPLPPKSRLFPPITSNRGGIGGDVGDRFGLGNTFPTNSTEELAKAPVSPPKGKEVDSNNGEQVQATLSIQNASEEHEPANEITTDPAFLPQATSRAHHQAKAPRKRTRWSQKETEDLLIGVSRFGIGRWKQILECADFQFQGRTAVDLKDRFRVCRPGEGLKARKLTTPEAPTVTISTASSKPDSEVRTLSDLNVVVHPAPSVHRSSEGVESATDAVTSKAGIHGPFLKSRRRARREFSKEDDKNLLKGFKRHGPSWHKLRDDFELGFGMRHPTDLRDRFRIRYPDLFAKAGYKLKPKEQRALKGRAEESKAQNAQAFKQPISTPRQPLNNGHESVARSNETTTAKAPSTKKPAPATTAPKAASIRSTFEPITDLTFDDDDEGDRSPIVLNRNILQWADENSTPAPSTTAAQTTTQPLTHSSTELLYNPFAPASDGLHINPLATLKLPSSTHWSYASPSTAAAAAASLPPPAPLKHTLPGSTATTMMTMTTTTTTTTTRAQQEMRTPNLPNIVFPYVPSASARNAVLNLPAPADILSSSGQTGAEGYIWIG